MTLKKFRLVSFSVLKLLMLPSSVQSFTILSPMESVELLSSANHIWQSTLGQSLNMQLLMFLHALQKWNHTNALIFWLRSSTQKTLLQSIFLGDLLSTWPLMKKKWRNIVNIFWTSDKEALGAKRSKSNMLKTNGFMKRENILDLAFHSIKSYMTRNHNFRI